MTTTEYKIESGIELPPITRAGTSAVSYPFDKLKINESFLVPASVSEQIKDPGERDIAMKEAIRKLSNRLSGAKRRFCKSNPTKDFALRTVPGQGVRCWRVNDIKAAK